MPSAWWNDRSAAVAENLARRVAPGHAADAASRMSAGTTLVQSLDRGTIIGPVRRRPGPEQLIELQLAVKDVSLRRADDRLDIGRRQHLHADDAAREAGRSLIEDAERALHQILLARAPVSFSQVIRRVA